MRKIVLLALAGIVAGCTSYESARSTHLAREYLTEDIEEQIVFNLIRAANGLPFAHYDVTTVQSTVTAKASGKAGGSKTNVSNEYQPEVVITNALHAITKVFNGEVGAERSNGVTINLAPVFDEPKIYTNYVKFLNLPAKARGEKKRLADTALNSDTPEMMAISKTLTDTTLKNRDGEVISTSSEVETNEEMPAPPPPRVGIDFTKFHSLRSDVEKPKAGSYVPHTVRRWDDCRWYYVPIEYTPEFSDLCLALVARGVGAPTTGGSAKKKDRGTKALEQLNSELMRQNTILDSR